MLQRISDFLFGPPYSRVRDRGRDRAGNKTRPLQKQLEQSVEWSSFLASGVEGVEDVSFADFVRRSKGSADAS